ncbi:hypothetical protein K523DRAFT_311755 [Schizophyllum commune Tattone D]|nr:hypothetical protein K523DRAFT_311755 [Schizophyllum commune Tattone D]
MLSASPVASSSRPTRDPVFYWNTIVFQVEGTLLRLPRAYLEQESMFFRDLFSFPDPPEGDVPHDGISDEKPLKIPPQVSLEEFHALAEILYPRTLHINRSPELSQEQWTGVLKLSDLWMMDRIKTLAVDALAQRLSDNPVEKIALARAYNVHDWYCQGICKLVQRQKPISPDDLARLGPSLTMKICELRECLVLKENTSRYGACGSWEMNDRRGYATCDAKVSKRVHDECASLL